MRLGSRMLWTYARRPTRDTRLGNWPFLPVRDKIAPRKDPKLGDQHIQIKHGIGNLHDMRFNCRPEVNILNLS